MSNKPYTVTVSLTEYASFTVDAISESDAESIALTMIEQEGIPLHAKSTDRDFSVDFVEPKNTTSSCINNL